MMEYVYTCDCCGKRVNEDGLTECYKGLETFDGEYDSFSGTPIRQKKWDLCISCLTKLKNAMQYEIGRIQNS